MFAALLNETKVFQTVKEQRESDHSNDHLAEDGREQVVDEIV